MPCKLNKDMISQMGTDEKIQMGTDFIVGICANLVAFHLELICANATLI